MKYREVAYFENIKDICVSYLYKNYDLCYLKAMHTKNANDGADTIIVGSSHAMNGIIESNLRNMGDVIQFSTSSQDFFYDYQHVKLAIQQRKKKIKCCIINFGYYMLYQDLSKSKLLEPIVTRIYMNLFGENCSHNLKNAQRCEPFSLLNFAKEMYPENAIRELCEFWCEKAMLEQATYYGELMSREQTNMLGVQKVIWDQMTPLEKKEYATQRTIDGHNKLIKYTESRNENVTILNDMVRLLNDNGIRIVFCVMPYTKYYNDLIDKRYKAEIFNVLDAMKYPVEFFDLNEYSDDFDDNDFMDSDHLNFKGANKATALLDQLLAL
jgi:hypothetical protein